MPLTAYIIERILRMLWEIEYRILYAFDPRRTAILLIGGAKTGDDRWYQVHVPRADDLYDEHLREIESEDGDG